MNKQPSVYLVTNRPHGTLYVGVTSNLPARAWQHATGVADGFTKRYNCKRLVWFETHEQMDTAIAREKAIKRWKRVWKIELVEAANPDWRDLYPDIVG